MSNERDLYLQALIFMVEQDPQNSASITLVVPGAVVHGQLIGWEAWRAAWKVQLRAVGTGTGVEAVAALPDVIDRAVERLRDELAGEDTEEDPLRHYVHLRNATVVSGAPSTSVTGVLWRGRVAEVVGWNLGRGNG
ncbi:hypothetical protein ABZ404_39065 [Streptomyces sp. NPDC005878]|uniref:hypothetical protein n=1 Tax=Streptomyces sp. NPDC005878 TaxID=3157077 RepID=UPI00340ACA67